MLYLPTYFSFYFSHLYIFPFCILVHCWFFLNIIIIIFLSFSNYLWIYNVPSFISWPLSNYHLTSIVAIADSSIPVAAGTGDIFHTFSPFLCFIGSASNNPFFLVNLNPPLLLVKHKIFFAWSSIDFQIFYEPSEINWHPGSPVVESWLRGRSCGASAAGCPQCSDVWCSRGDGGVGCFLRKRKSAGPEMIWVFFGKAAVWFWEIGEEGFARRLTTIVDPIPHCPSPCIQYLVGVPKTVAINMIWEWVYPRLRTNKQGNTTRMNP